MKLTGTRKLDAPQQTVWQKLNDAEILKKCIPGCQSLEQLDADHFKATVGLKIGPVNAKFNGNVKLSDIDPPNSYRIEGSGKGGPAGGASGSASVRLETHEGSTVLSYEVDAKVTGKIAQLGSRLIDATAASLAEKFFDNFASELETDDPAPDQPAPTDVVPARTSIPLIAGVAIAAIIVALILFQL